MIDSKDNLTISLYVDFVGQQIGELADNIIAINQAIDALEAM